MPLESLCFEEELCRLPRCWKTLAATGARWRCAESSLCSSVYLRSSGRRHARRARLRLGAFTFADGILSLVAAFKVRDQGKPFWSLLIVGLLGIAAGIVTFLWPGMTSLLLVVFIGAWAFLMGIFQIVAAIRLRREIEGEVAAGAVGPAVDAVRAVRLLAARRRRASADLGHRRLRDLLWHAC